MFIIIYIAHDFTMFAWHVHCNKMYKMFTEKKSNIENQKITFQNKLTKIQQPSGSATNFYVIVFKFAFLLQLKNAC